MSAKHSWNMRLVNSLTAHTHTLPGELPPPEFQLGRPLLCGPDAPRRQTWRPYQAMQALLQALGFWDDQNISHRSLGEERETDGLLTQLGKGELNREAHAA